MNDQIYDESDSLPVIPLPVDLYLQQKGDDPEHKWEKLGIEPGIWRELADNVGAFGRRALSHARTSTVSTARHVLIPSREGYGHGQSTEGGFEDETLYDDGEATLDRGSHNQAARQLRLQSPNPSLPRWLRRNGS